MFGTCVISDDSAVSRKAMAAAGQRSLSGKGAAQELSGRLPRQVKRVPLTPGESPTNASKDWARRPRRSACEWQHMAGIRRRLGNPSRAECAEASGSGIDSVRTQAVSAHQGLSGRQHDDYYDIVTVGHSLEWRRLEQKEEWDGTVWSAR